MVTSVHNYRLPSSYLHKASVISKGSIYKPVLLFAKIDFFFFLVFGGKQLKSHPEIQTGTFNTNSTAAGCSPGGNPLSTPIHLFMLPSYLYIDKMW